MEHICPLCKKSYDGVSCATCDTAAAGNVQTAFLVDLVSNRKIPIPVPSCKAGRDEANDIVISGDQSISRYHFNITKEGNQYFVQDNKSRHGTFLNGTQITDIEQINDGDVLKVGVSLFWFVIEVPSQVANEQAPALDLTGVDTFGIGGVKGSPGGTTADSVSPLGVSGKKKKGGVGESSTSDSIPTIFESALGSKLGLKVHGSRPEDLAENQGIARLRSPNFSDKDHNRELQSQTQDSLPAIGADSLTSNPPTSPIPPSGSPSRSIANISLHRFDTGAKDLERLAKKYANQEVDSAFNKLLKPDSAEAMAASLDAQANSAGVIEAFVPPQANIEVEQPEMLPDATAFEPTPVGLGGQRTSILKEENHPPSTLEKFAEIIGEAAAQDIPTHTTESYGATSIQDQVPLPLPPESAYQATNIGVDVAGNGAEKAACAQKEPRPAGTPPDWCDRYFVNELTTLSKEQSDLKEQMKALKQRVRDIENRMATTTSIRNTLLSMQGDELVAACAKVFDLLGWKVAISEDDKQELKLLIDDKIVIARVVWTDTQPERSHLGQLNIAQTKYWCEQFIEPKGILIVSRISDQPPVPLTAEDFTSDIATFASKKNMCLMTTLQLLAIYCDVAIKQAGPDSIREAILSTHGWLSGFNLEPQPQDQGAKLGFWPQLNYSSGLGYTHGCDGLLGHYARAWQLKCALVQEKST